MVEITTSCENVKSLQWQHPVDECKTTKKPKTKKNPRISQFSEKQIQSFHCSSVVFFFTSPSLFAGGSSGAGETGEVKGDASSTTGSCSAGSGWTVCSDGGSSSTGSEETKMRRRWSGFIHTVKYSQSNQTCGSRPFLWTTDLVTSDHITNVTQI